MLWFFSNSHQFERFLKWLKGVLEHHTPWISWSKKLVLEGHITYTRSCMYCHMSDELKGVLHYLNENLDNMSHVRNVESISVGNNDIFTLALNVPIQKSYVQIGNGMCVSIVKYKEEAKSEYGANINVHVLLTLSSNTMMYGQMRAFLKDCATKYKLFVHNKSGSQMIFEYRCNDDNDKPVFDAIPFTSNKTFDNLFFDGKEEIMRRVMDFESSKGRERSHRLGMQHSLGILFHGAPGCGKTSAIKAIANLTGRHIIIIRMDRIIRQKPNDCIDVLKTIMQSNIVGEVEIPQKNRLWVFEEVDCWQHIIKSRRVARTPSKNHHGKRGKDSDPDNHNTTMALIDALQQVSSAGGPAGCNNNNEFEFSQLGSLLELLDGLMEMQDRMIIMTTNHPDKMDDALIRPGRIDICHEFKRLSRRHVCDLYKLWYGVEFPQDKVKDVYDNKFSQAELAQLFALHDHQSILEMLAGHI